MNNKYTAESTIELAGKPYTLSFNWEQRAAFKSLYKDDSIIIDTLKNASANPEILAELVACCLKHHHPDITPDFVRKNSPPIIPLANALQNVILYSLWGPDGPPSESGQADNSDSKKKG